MKQINGNKSVILGMAQRGELTENEIIYSEVNKCKYIIVKCNNHQGEWIGVKEVI
jgi:hypothetical protein